MSQAAEVGQALTASQFERLYREVAPELSRYVRRHRSADAEDVVAEVFVTAWRRRADLPKASLHRAWLFGTARRLLLAAARADRRDQEVVQHLATQPANTAGSRESGATSTVMSALARLRPADRELIELIEWENLSPAEVAAILGVRPGTVRVRLHRARRTLAADPSIQELATQSPASGPAIGAHHCNGC